MASPAASVQAVNLTDGKSHEKAVLTPPTSEDWNKNDGSDLSDLEEEHEEEDIVPDHYWDGGEIPVFKPVRRHFDALANAGLLRQGLLYPKAC